MWPDLRGGAGAGPISGDLLFFTATIPIAVSGVYKEIAFKSVQDMDVWYLNGYVALPQFLIGLLYAPLAAVMTGTLSFFFFILVLDRKKKKSCALVVVGGRYDLPKTTGLFTYSDWPLVVGWRTLASLTFFFLTEEVILLH